MTEAELTRALHRACDNMPPTTVMEVCGTHTHSIARSGLRRLLPSNLRLIYGPGCPVCVTPEADISAALVLARMPDTIVASFGDMLRVPVSAENGFDSLYRQRGLGRGVRIATSPLDALKYAQQNPDREVVWFAVGFETTAPHTAALILRAETEGIRNLSVLCSHKTMPAALDALLRSNKSVDALLCPGHVAALTGADAFRFVPESLHMPGVVSGFEPSEILLSLTMIAAMRQNGKIALENAYPAAVRQNGNEAALALLGRVFVPCDAEWRGLGVIKNSGLAICPRYKAYDARVRFGIQADSFERRPPGKHACRCADILRGELTPSGCPLFGKTCTPEHPFGPCMVSSEGACSAAYLYGGAL